MCEHKNIIELMGPQKKCELSNWSKQEKRKQEAIRHAFDKKLDTSTNRHIDK